MSPSTLVQVDPTQVRLELSVSRGFELDLAESRLSLTLSGSGGTRRGQMALSLLGVRQESRSNGLFRPDVPVSTYSLALSPEGVQELRELQRFMLTGAPETFELSVRAPFATAPPEAREVTFWADLKMSAEDPFSPLISGAKLRLENAPAGS
ncbi:hypothetical protein FZO89_10890 [Luteimonas viscosa]|uniref:Uncharacterized protein n=2 Tax=Luteimonas viscosa TaxID=1132694 RepID=A0A5D4XS11_9GAMM|nr:hypothetical protein FZO89_10890 [Luteimonas viscosa]